MLGRASRLQPQIGRVEIAEPLLDVAIREIEAVAAAPERLQQRSSAMPRPQSKLAEPQAAQQLKARPEQSTAGVSLTSFQVLAALIAPGWGLLVHLPKSQNQLTASQFVALEKLVDAMQTASRSHTVFELTRFQWPPRRGLAASLNQAEMGLAALKGFLHSMAAKQKISWLVLDDEFARFCFQDPNLQALQVLERGEQRLVIAPAMEKLFNHDQSKRALWQLLKPLL